MQENTPVPSSAGLFHLGYFLNKLIELIEIDR